MMELKKCPFCGSEPELKGTRRSGKYIVVEYDESKYNVFWICCVDCKQAGTKHVDSKEAAIKAWNTRTPDKLTNVVYESTAPGARLILEEEG